MAGREGRTGDRRGGGAGGRASGGGGRGGRRLLEIRVPFGEYVTKFMAITHTWCTSRTSINAMIPSGSL